jgi:RND family efflux transporter MFP subunit
MEGKMMVISKNILALSLVVTILAAGIYFFVFRVPAKTRVEANGEVPARPAGGDAPLPVKAVPVVRGDLVIRLMSPGEVFARKRAAIKTEVSGALKEVAAEEGRAVRAGDVLARIDDRIYVLRLESAEAERLRRLSEMLVENRFGGVEKRADADIDEKIRDSAAMLEASAARYAAGGIGLEEYDRIRKAHETLLIEAGRKREEVQAASKGLTQAEVEVAVARLGLERTKVRAPFSGILTGIKVSVGETVSPGQDLMTIVDVRDIRVEARVLESEIGRMKPGREADVRFSAYPGRVFKDRVRAVSPVVDPSDRTCAVHVAIDNGSGEIKPGMHAEVEVAAEIYEGRLLVPQEAVLVRGGRKLVFVVEKGLAKWKYIETGLENERYVEILKGVSEGEKVIVDGHLTLAHDARITLTE